MTEHNWDLQDWDLEDGKAWTEISTLQARKLTHTPDGFPINLKDWEVHFDGDGDITHWTRTFYGIHYTIWND